MNREIWWLEEAWRIDYKGETLWRESGAEGQSIEDEVLSFLVGVTVLIHVL